MDGTENQKDTLQENGQPSSEDKQGTSPKEAKTYTDEEVNKRVSDALAKAGRDAKALADQKASIEAQQQEIDATKSEIDEMQKRIDEAELEAARGDPDKLRDLQTKKSYKDQLAALSTKKKEQDKREAELNRREAENAETVKSAQQHQMEMSLWEIAAEAGINPQTLKDGVKDLNLTTVEQAKALAKRLKPTGERPPEGEVEGEKVTPIPVPTTGGSHGTLTLEQRGKQSMEDYAATRKKEEPDKFPL